MEGEGGGRGPTQLQTGEDRGRGPRGGGEGEWQNGRRQEGGGCSKRVSPPTSTGSNGRRVWAVVLLNGGRKWEGRNGGGGGEGKGEERREGEGGGRNERQESEGKCITPSPM